MICVIAEGEGSIPEGGLETYLRYANPPMEGWHSLWKSVSRPLWQCNDISMKLSTSRSSKYLTTSKNRHTLGAIGNHLRGFTLQSINSENSA